MSGSCFCKKIRVSWTGEPISHSLCHCLDCRKISGGMYSNNLAVLEDNFKVESGTPKKMTKTGDSGKTVTYYFCPDCGVTLWGVLEVAPGAIIIKIGLTDDPEWSQKNVPTVELYTKSRLSWIDPLEGAVQKETM